MISFYRIKVVTSLIAAMLAVTFIAYLKFEDGWYSIVRLLQTNFVVILAFVIYAAFFYDLLALATDKKGEDTQIKISTGKEPGDHQVSHAGKFALYVAALIFFSMFLMENARNAKF